MAVSSDKCAAAELQKEIDVTPLEQETGTANLLQFGEMWELWGTELWQISRFTADTYPFA